jgi:hypothetical protein
METYKLYIEDRSYSKWIIYETSNFQVIDLIIDPAKSKLFSNDIFSIDDSGNTKLIHSTIQSGPPMSGVLIIDGNKTYGRQHTKNGKDGKLLYKCIPDDMRLPHFLVPYEIKNVGFSKVFINLYVTFSYKEWDDKHPHGILDQLIGPVDVLDNFYEYQLYCKSLNASIQKFQKDTTRAIQNNYSETFIENIRIKYPSIEDRTDWFVFTIDPVKSVDYDDGFSIKQLDNNIQQISIYIANVTILMDVLNLWDSFSRRISTIYLPDRRRPMLPTILSDSLCSLQSNHSRLAFVMDIFISNDDIIDIKYSNCMIKVHKNYSYEEPDLLINPNYIHLLDVSKRLSKKYKYINNVRNSHELVCYLMVFMNYYCATEMVKHNNGIFRSTIIKTEVSIPDNIPEDVGKFIKIWNSSCGQYMDGSELTGTQNVRHELLELDAYIHITSPIRRLVDLLNIIKFQQNTGLIQLSDKSNEFYNKWVNDLDYINITMRSIRKVQTDCSLLDLCANNPNIMETEYTGYLFDKIARNDGLFQFMVFLPELKLSSRITLRENINNFENRKFKLFLFNDEENFKKKIRLHLLG